MDPTTNSPASSRVQNVIVMRHGDRIDNAEPLWTTTAKRPWDPPLIDSGKVRAFSTGRKLRNNLGFPINRVIVSPFTRCIQTASEVVSALCAVNDDTLVETSGDNISIDPSKLKVSKIDIVPFLLFLHRPWIRSYPFGGYVVAEVSVEFGLCEIISREAIRPDFAPKDGIWGFKIPELEAKFPAGTVDTTAGLLYPEMPKWEESLLDARARYACVIHELADKFPSENLLLVTHGEGVGVAISAFSKDTVVYEVEYCAYAHLQRQISFNSDRAVSAGNFDIATKHAQSGIRFCPASAVALNAPSV
ncbi:hypothetical protein IFM89_030569 [Coptis chinensis]|uniref:Phosphoglycerate mutase family protein n=1 Tax=Coptis chinensis TaxID=261450 RepID=A0A835LX49_9MAGN|nr:hypothetical protein IFM89_030569 [Coptis chinensis]